MIANPRDIRSLVAILNVPQRDVGESLQRKIREMHQTTDNNVAALKSVAIKFERETLNKLCEHLVAGQEMVKNLLLC